MRSSRPPSRCSKTSAKPAFSVRKLAQSVGCDPMSVLYHFKSKEGLSRAIANALSRSLVPVDPSLPWRERLRSLARQYRALALRYPAAFALLQRHMSTGPADLAHIEAVHRALADAGIPRAALPSVCVGWYASVIGLAAAEAGGLTRAANDVEPRKWQRCPTPRIRSSRRPPALCAARSGSRARHDARRAARRHREAGARGLTGPRRRAANEKAPEGAFSMTIAANRAQCCCAMPIFSMT